MKYPLFICLLLLHSALFAQTLKGVVRDHEGKGLPAANVIWQEENNGTATAQDGSFELPVPEAFPATLTVSFVGFQSYSQQLNQLPQQLIEIQLEPFLELNTVEVQGKTNSTSISMMETLHTEKLGIAELEKAACCNLSESFETNASVDVALADAVTGTKKIRMLGLDGVYTQILSEGIPYLRGISGYHGLSHVPGTWVESIQVTKGTGSVTNGYEATTGQINLEFRKPDELETEKLFLNGYLNGMGRAELNLHGAQRLSEKWSTITYAHVSDRGTEIDQNDDGFIDAPKTRQYNLFNRWKYKGEFFRFQAGLRAMHEEVQAGQVGFDYDRDFESRQLYGIGNTVSKAEVFTKTGFLFNDQPGRSIGIMMNGRYYDQDGFFGIREYEGEETYFYANGIHQMELGSCKHLLKTGLSYMRNDLREVFNDSTYNRLESVPGAFGEYNYKANRWSIVAGLRADYHNLYDWFVTPRLHAKFLLGEESTMRFSAGRGYRVANVFVENTSALISSRQVSRAPDLQPEVAWNGGVTLTHHFHLFGREFYLNADYFRTEFENQVVVDLEDPRMVKFYNLTGRSFSNSVQVETGVEITEGLDIKTAYKWYDVQTEFQDGLKTRPLIPKHRVMANAAYATAAEKWKFDVTANWIGQVRLPSTAANTEANQRSEESEAYTLLNAQITKKFRKWSLYTGGENLLAYTQDNPIIAPNDPFGPEFDASLVWAPINAPVIYVGFRYTL